MGGGEAALLPQPLPPRDWSFPVELWPLLAEAKRYLGELEGIGSVLPDPTILLRPMVDREAIQSSALEGTYATPKELLLFELEPVRPRAQSLVVVGFLRSTKTTRDVSPKSVAMFVSRGSSRASSRRHSSASRS